MALTPAQLEALRQAYGVTAPSTAAPKQYDIAALKQKYSVTPTASQAEIANQASGVKYGATLPANVGTPTQDNVPTLIAKGAANLPSAVVNFAKGTVGVLGQMATDVVKEAPKLGQDIKTLAASPAQTLRAGKELATKVPKAAYEVAVFDFLKQLGGAAVDIGKGDLPAANKNIQEATRTIINDPLEVAAIAAMLKGQIQKSAAKVTEKTGIGAKKVTDTSVATIEKPASFGAMKSAANDVLASDNVTGLGQAATELAQRFPRAGAKIQDFLTTKAEKAARIKASKPAVADALRANLDERFINTVAESDKPTLQAYKSVLDVADKTQKTLGMKENPTKVGGEAAAQQFDIINKQKKTVGKQIGAAVSDLSKTTKVDMSAPTTEMNSVLSENGIVNKKGQLDFSGSKFTPTERTQIQQLYTLATEGGKKLTPAQIYLKDQLFSKLQRESRFSGVGDLIVNTADGGVSSLFKVFRDIYSKTLDDVSPDIRTLNGEYRKLVQITDDIENSILKTPNYEIVKSLDPAEFAKINLRRIFGESQSSPVFEGVADAMDKLSRDFGYTGATPKTIAEFAQELRKLYPETIPQTGFSGGIRASVGDLLNKAIEAGKSTVVDQRNALRKLIESQLNVENTNKKTSTPSMPTTTAVQTPQKTATSNNINPNKIPIQKNPSTKLPKRK